MPKLPPLNPGSLIQLLPFVKRWQPFIQPDEILFVVERFNPWYEAISENEEDRERYVCRYANEPRDSAVHPDVGNLLCLLPNGKLQNVRDWYLDKDFVILKRT